MVPLLLCTAVLAAGQSQIHVTYQGKLADAARMPAVVSPDGRRLLYFAQEVMDEEGRRRTRFAYCLADADGSNPQKLFRTPVDWDDYLNALISNASFSADGRHIAVATTDNGRPLRVEDPGKVVPGICDLAGNVRLVKCSRGSTGGFGFAGDELVFLDTPGLNAGKGYQLKVLGDGRQRNVDADTTRAALCLRVAPDGEHAVFFTADEARSAQVRLRMVNLKTGQLVESPEFRSQQVTFDGRPQLFWDAAGEGVFCHVSTHQNSKWPFELTHYDLTTGEGFVVTPTRNVGASCVLDENHVAVWHPDGHGCSVVDVHQRKAIAMPQHNYLLGGRGRRVVVADLDRDAIYAAEIELPAVEEQASP